MSKKTMTEHIAILTDESSAVAGIYLDHACSAILNRLYPFLDPDTERDITMLPKRYEPLAETIAVYLINKRGAEGETSHNENGTYRSYESAHVPESMLKEIIPMAKVIGRTAE